MFGSKGLASLSDEDDDTTPSEDADSIAGLAMGAALSSPDSGTPSDLNAYIRSTRDAPMLSLEGERELAQQAMLARPGAVCDDGAAPGPQQLKAASDAIHALAHSHMRLVVAISRQFSGYQMPQDDLIQEGNMGLLKAIHRFDPDYGTRLSSYAMPWIRAEMQEYVLRNARMVRMATTKPQRKLFFNLRALAKTPHALPQPEPVEEFGAVAPVDSGADVSSDGIRPLGRLKRADIERIASQLEVDENDVIEMDVRLSGVDHSLEALIQEQDEEGTRGRFIASWLADERMAPDVLLQRQQADRQACEGLRMALKTLDPRSRHIIESRWLVDGEGQKPTLEDLAGHYKVSGERIRQIESAALRKMRSHMKNGPAFN